MTWFNLHHGQRRANTHVGGVAISSAMRDTSPKKALHIYHMAEGKTVKYVADEFGNVEVIYTPHLTAMMNLGWPINEGSRNQITSVDQLIYPFPEVADDPYHRIILSGLKARAGE